MQPGAIPMNDESSRAWAAILPRGGEVDPSRAQVRRQAPRSRIGRGWPSVRRIAVGLALVATLVIVLMDPPGWLRSEAAGDGPGAAADVGGAQEPSEDDEQALAEFLKVYRLEPDEVLKHVPPPRPKGIREYWKRDRPGFANRAEQFGAMTFRWQDPDRLKSWSMTTADEGFRVRDLPRYLELNIYESEMDGAPDLLNTPVPGDWIYRLGTPADRMVRALDIRLQRTLQKRLSLKLRTVERDVVVVKGEYRPTPVAGRGQDEFEIYGKQIVPGGGGAGGGSGTYAEFLKWVGEWIERPVVSDVQPPPTNRFAWYYNERNRSTEQTRREDHDEAMVLKHLHEQTGLTFTRERRPIPILFVERVK
jgi:hypothetical protein